MLEAMTEGLGLEALWRMFHDQQAGLLMVDEGGRVRLSSPRAAAMLGMEPVLAGFGPGAELPDGLRPLVRHVLETGRPVQGRVADVHGNCVEASLTPCRAGVLATLWDVSEYARVHAHRRMLFRGTSHELRNPLTTVLGYLSLLLDPATAGMDDEQRRTCYRVMRHESRRVLHLMQDLLTLFSLDQDGGLRICPQVGRLEDVVARCVEHHQMTSARHRIELDVASALPPVRLDEERITQVMVNLLSNAVKYSPEGGEIRVEVTAADGRARVRVTDHGLGVAAVDRELIFAGFHRAHPDLPGNGIGLYVSRLLVEAHGGAIGVEETPGGGATFWFEVPGSA